MEERWKERLETAKKLSDIASKMREVAGDIINVYEEREISYIDFMHLIDKVQYIMETAVEKSNAIYDSIIMK